MIARHASPDSHFVTDESKIYGGIGWNFASHETVCHSAEEYVRGDVHTMAASTPGEFRFVRGCFWTAALGTIATHLWWQWGNEQPLSINRILIAAVIGAIAIGGLALSLDWVKRKQEQAQSQARPVVSPAAPQNADTNLSKPETSPEKESPLPLEKALHVGPISVGFDKMKTERWIEIDITAHNGSGTNLRIGNILGHIELNPVTSLHQSLPSPTFLSNTTKDIPPGSEFYVTLMQRFPDGAWKAAMAALNRRVSIQLNFSELKISVSEIGNENTKAFLPLWDGVTIEKKANKYLTGKLLFLNKPHESISIP